jgi:uncharacterized protein (UPF0276 family)
MRELVTTAINPPPKVSGVDRVGIGWRPELGLGILEQIEQIDLIEVLAEHCFSLRNAELKAFKRLSSQTTLVVHALSLGLASVLPVKASQLAAVARVVAAIEPEAWSEHLAFVRTEQIELEHLTTPPWSEETIEGALRNIQTATQVIGSKPDLENIARLYQPLASSLSEAQWTARILERADCRLLLDLENIYANARTFRTDWREDLLSFPLQRVRYVHIAGGQEAHDQQGEYFLDDHKQPVSPEVFEMLEILAATVPQPLAVVLERDGNYPDFNQLQAELTQAREAMARGRARQALLVA